MSAWRPTRKKWSKSAWDQLRNIRKKSLKELLDKDPKWSLIVTKTARATYYNPVYPPPYDHVSIHIHPTEGFRREGLLRDLLDRVCWTEDSLREMKAIK